MASTSRRKATPASRGGGTDMRDGTDKRGGKGGTDKRGGNGKGSTEKRPDHPRPPLDRDTIVAAALAIVDRDGMTGLTMRALGKELGADPMSVYSYFADKAALLSGIVEHEAARLADPPQPFPVDATDFLVHIALHYRAVVLDHPALAPLLLARPLHAPAAAQTAIVGTTLLRLAGVAEDRLVVAAGTFTRVSLGMILHEALQTSSLRDLGVDRAAHRAEIRHALRDADAGDVEHAVVERQGSGEAAAEELAAAMRAVIAAFRAP